MNEFANILSQKRYVITVFAFVIPIMLLAPLLQAHHTSITEQIQASYADQEGQVSYDSSNVVSNALSQMGANAGQAIVTAKIKTLSSIMQATASITHFDNYIVQGTHTAVALTSRGISLGVTYTAHAIGGSFAFTAHTIGDSLAFTTHTIGKAYGSLAKLTHVSALIRPNNHTPTPTISQMRAEEAAIIQSGTINVAPPVATATTAISTGVGGACDNGEGNGGYPMSWCNAPMDSIATLSFNSDPINRECTSYAYWYFTNVEGHTNFEAWGNAKYWATTSNYPTNTTPVVGAIAVETAGAYGHVAIVQALPGQKYAGQVVPAGYVLVSEMNYDWNGHFRYSYSPLSKFSAYIYP